MEACLDVSSSVALGIKRCWQCNPPRPWSSDAGEPRWQDRLWPCHAAARWAGVAACRTRRYPHWDGCGSTARPALRRPRLLSGVTPGDGMAKARPGGANVVAAALPAWSLWVFLFTCCLLFPTSKCSSLRKAWCLERKGSTAEPAAPMALASNTFGTRGCSRSLRHHHSLGRKAEWGA